MKEFSYTSSDGESIINAYIWDDAKDNAGGCRGILQLVHGFSEHSMRYREFAEHMSAAGYIVCAHDQLGHGRSAAGRFGYIGKNGHKLLVKDTYKLTAMVKDKYKDYDLPVVIMGVGTGSLVARYVCSLWGIEYSGAIFSGTTCGGVFINTLYRLLALSQDVRMGRLKRKRGQKEALRINKLMHGRYNKAFRNSEHGQSWLSRDKEEVNAFNADPLCGFALTYGACIDFLKLARITNSRGWPVRIPKNMPIYLFSGLNDPMGDFGRGVIKVYGELVNAQCTDIEIKLYEDARHEMLFELNKDEVYEDILKWLNS